MGKVYAIGDLHLSFGQDKLMDVFCGKWIGYVEKLKNEWQNTVDSDDFVIITGDISWAKHLNEAVESLKFIDNLNGKKIIIRGNHDYWWDTYKKMSRLLSDHHLSSIFFLQNNSIVIGKAAICGTRGWKCPGDAEFDDDDMKIFKREKIRLELSIEEAKKHMGVNAGEDKKIIVALHYPPFTKTSDDDYTEVLKKYRVNICVYGHLHGEKTAAGFNGIKNDIEYRLVSADYLNFKPAFLGIV